VDPLEPDPGVIERAAAILRGGGLVAFPTETVYGLGASAIDTDAIARVFRAKRRPPADPLIAHVATAAGITVLTDKLPEIAQPLMARFWPGPLTLVLPRAPSVPPILSGGRDTVAVRMPQHAVALALISAVGVPVAAPSANRFGRVSPTTAGHVLDELDGAFDLLLDAGATRVGVESTVVDLTTPVPAILRPGAVTVEELREILPGIADQPRAVDREPRSPGRYLRHYAPATPVVLVDCAEGAEVLAALADGLGSAGIPIAVLATSGDPMPPGTRAIELGSAEHPAVVAARLYAALREADGLGTSLILARTVGDAGVGAAVNDRLFRAAQGRRVVNADQVTLARLVHLATAADPRARGMT